MLKKYFAKIIQGVIYMATTLLTFFGFFELGRKSQIIIIIVCALGYVVFCIVDILREKNKKHDTVRLKEYSDEFFDYFEDWYRKLGTLRIFCADLDWMRKGTRDLVSTICDKGSNCTVYLRGPVSQSDRQRLESAGVKIVIVDTYILTSRRFSLVEYEDSASLIIRNQKTEAGFVEFKETDSAGDPYLINLTKDLLELLDKQHGGEQHD